MDQLHGPRTKLAGRRVIRPGGWGFFTTLARAIRAAARFTPKLGSHIVRETINTLCSCLTRYTLLETTAVPRVVGLPTSAFHADWPPTMYANDGTTDWLMKSNWSLKSLVAEIGM